MEFVLVRPAYPVGPNDGVLSPSGAERLLPGAPHSCFAASGIPTGSAETLKCVGEEGVAALTQQLLGEVRSSGHTGDRLGEPVDVGRVLSAATASQ